MIDQIKKGNKQAFKTLFDELYPGLCLFAEKYLNDKDLSQDVVQNAFIRYWENRMDFHAYRSVRSFLYTVIRNQSLNHLKQAKSKASLAEIQETGEESFYLQQILEQETFFHTKMAINALPERMRMIIEHSLQGLKNKEIAEKMGISPLTVHTAKKRAYRKLREWIKNRPD